MKVWIVTKWFAYEGEDIIGVYDTEEKAITRIKLEENGRDFNTSPYLELYEWDVE